MVRSRKPPSDDQLFEAVELRSGGWKWESVAQQLKRSVETVRKWPVRYADRWQAAMSRAEQRLAVDTEAEAVVALRTILRADDIKMRWHAAKTIIGMRIDLGKIDARKVVHAKAGPTDFDKAKIAVELLENTPFEEFERLINLECERQAQLSASAQEASPTNAA